jgi:hypothetical protein
MLRPGKQPSNNGDYYPNQSGGSYYNNDAYAYNAGYNQNYQQHHQQQQQQQSYNSGGRYYNGGAAPMYDSSYSQPQQQTLPSPRRSPAESPIMSLLKNKWIWTLLLCFLLFCLSIYHYKQHKTVLSKLKVSSAEQAERLFQDTERERLKWKKDSHVNMHAQEEYKSKIATLTAENEKLLLKLENSKLSAKRESAMKRQIELLQNATSRESKRAVLDKFGPGPHRVKLTLKVPNGKNKDVTLETVVVEMAPLHLVPHAIHLFLEQVSHKLWDGTYVYLNGPHIMQSGPQGHDNRHKITSGVQRFSDQQLDKLAFPEYSPEYPHLPYVSLMCFIVVVVVVVVYHDTLLLFSHSCILVVCIDAGIYWPAWRTRLLH